MTKIIKGNQMTIRNLCFYKASGQPWTLGEYADIIRYVGDIGDDPEDTFMESCSHCQYIYDNGDFSSFMHHWSEQDPGNCTLVSYESVFLKRKLLKPRKLNGKN